MWNLHVYRDAERQGLDPGLCLVYGLPVREDTRELDNLCNPAPVRFLLGFDEKPHLAP